MGVIFPLGVLHACSPRERSDSTTFLSSVCEGQAGSSQSVSQSISQSVGGSAGSAKDGVRWDQRTTKLTIQRCSCGGRGARRDGCFVLIVVVVVLLLVLLLLAVWSSPRSCRFCPCAFYPSRTFTRRKLVRVRPDDSSATTAYAH